MTKSEIRQWVKEQLGAPMVKIELTDQQIDNNIDYARDRFIKIAIGNVNQETHMTMMLSGGQAVYDLPTEVTEVVDYIDASSSSMGGNINTLFTIENYFYSQGMLANLHEPFNLVGYHIALEFLETLNRYVHSQYQWKYNKFRNQLTLSPTPPTSAAGGGNVTTYTDAGSAVINDSPGYVLLRIFKLEAEDEDIYGEQTVQDYTLALCMRTLGFVRRKFASFSSVGNQGLALDGSELISEAETLIEKLEERMKDEDCHMGFGIEMG